MTWFLNSKVHPVLVYPVIFLVEAVSPATRFVPILFDRVTSRSVLDWTVTGATGRGLDNHNIVLVACHPNGSRVVSRLIRVYLFSLRFIPSFTINKSKRAPLSRRPLSLPSPIQSQRAPDSNYQHLQGAALTSFRAFRVVLLSTCAAILFEACALKQMLRGKS